MCMKLWNTDGFGLDITEKICAPKLDTFFVSINNLTLSDYTDH